MKNQAIFAILSAAQKGTNKIVLRPTVYETFDELRDFYLDYIRVNREVIKALKNGIDHSSDVQFKKDCWESIHITQEENKQIYEELKECQRWWIKTGKSKYEERVEKLNGRI